MPRLFNDNFGAGDTATTELFYPPLVKLNHAVTGGMNSKVAAHKCTIAGALSHADLPDDDITGLNLRTAGYF